MNHNAASIAAEDVSAGLLVFGLIGMVVAFAVIMMAEVATDALARRFPAGPGIMIGAGAVSLVLASIFSSALFGIVGVVLLGIPVLLILFGGHNVRGKWHRS
ncbi:hypothetical protein [Arthrobacter sp. AZCC_0090]|uniref:hypothetical protein n=1 Tax=Arthrobacter sp. AZCC_0090 TaxID=2735881 RepID=UPI00161965CF|nr:hypothetical protein [Arthrobacter sp. AZCC_0090]MBB6405718.1 hypothetical protein [Arthrobacter sp. AZCC_0090]